MAKLLVEVSDKELKDLQDRAQREGRTAHEIASELISQAMDPWARAWEIVERGRRTAGLTEDEADALALAEVEELRRERHRGA